MAKRSEHSCLSIIALVLVADVHARLVQASVEQSMCFLQRSFTDVARVARTKAVSAVQEDAQAHESAHAQSRFSFPPWYYAKVQGLTPSSCPKPDKHLYATDVQKLLRAMDAFFQAHNITYSLWGGSLLAVARARQHSRKAVAMPWDFDVDFILTEESFTRLHKMVGNINDLPFATAAERDASALRLDECLYDIDGGLTLLNDNMIRISTTSYAHGDFKAKWYPKLLNWAATLKRGLNLDVVMQPGRYADILYYRHIAATDKVEPCDLEGVTVSCASAAFTYSDSEAGAKATAAEFFQRLTPYGKDSTDWGWEQEDHVWSEKTCEFACAPEKYCGAITANMLLNELEAGSKVESSG